MGPTQAVSALREAMAMGVEDAILLTDSAFAGSDTQATAMVLAAAIRKIKDYDIIICGRQAIDGDTAQVGPHLAEYLQLPQITYVAKVDIQDRHIIAQRRYENGFFVVHSTLPILLTAIKELNHARLPSIPGIRAAFSQPIRFWGLADLDIGREVVGLEGSPTKVLRSFVPQYSSRVEFLEGSPPDIAAALIHELQKRHIISI
jgi:electron transfer flavoprotein beta subunit